VTSVVLAGVGTAVGIVGLLRGLWPAPVSLASALRVLERDPGRDGSDLGDGALTGSSRRLSTLRVDRRLADHFARLVWRDEAIRGRLAPMLAVTGTSVQTVCGEVVLGAAVGLLLPGLGWTVLTTGGLNLPFVVPLWTGLVLAGLGGALPVALLQARANRARRDARRLVGSFLNLVVLSLAGGMGVESALHAAARAGGDQVSAQILEALALAQDAGVPPWMALDQVGRRLGVPELIDLAAVVGLAGSEGARIRTTLAAKAGSIRRRDLAEAEARANGVTERLFLPGVLLLVGFLVFIAYPAISRISSGL